MADAWFHLYTLHSRGSLNAVSRRSEFHGALIKVDDGVGCLHPWPEFGDEPIEEQLNLLRDGGSSRVIERTLRMAAVDGEARKSGRSLFDGLEIPRSHYSWDLNQPPGDQAQRVIQEGWRAIKAKGSKRPKDTLEWMEHRSADLGPQDCANTRTGNRIPVLRIDFNSCLTLAEFADFMRAIPSEARRQLDFVEDPFPYEAGSWTSAQKELGVRLACDKGVARTEGPRSGEAGYAVAVLKPGRRDWREIAKSLPPDVRIVMTSAMDHAIGQSFAAYESALAWKDIGARMDLCGLCTEHLFAEDEFFERIQSHGGMLRVDREGTGLGFDEVLTRLSWKKL